MSKTFRRMRAAALLAGLALMPGTLRAQRAPAGGGVFTTALLPPSHLGSGQSLGFGGQLGFGLAPAVSFEGSLASFGRTQIEAGDLRAYRAVAPAVTLRASLLGRRSDLAGLFSLGAVRYSLEAAGGTPAERWTMPMMGIGLALRLHLAGPFYSEISGRSWFFRARHNQFGATPGASGFSYMPEVRVSLLGLLRKGKPKLARLNDLPITYRDDFRPVAPSAVVFEPNATTSGRRHMHLDGNTEYGVGVIPAPQFHGETAPSLQSLLVPTGPATVYDSTLVGVIRFQTGSYAVDADYVATLREVGIYLSQHPEARLMIVAYADHRGASTMNISLAEKRGTAVKELLARLFSVAPDRMEITAIGIDRNLGVVPEARRVELYAKVPIVPK